MGGAMKQQGVLNEQAPNERASFNNRFQLDYASFSALRELLCMKPNHSTLQSRFACFLALHLPEVAARIDEDDFGVLNLEVGVLAMATNDAIASNDWNTVRKHFSFISDTLGNIGGELRDAIQVYYLNYLLLNDMDNSRLNSHDTIPQRLKITFDKLKEHFGLMT
jgi:hypothetical protein